MVDNTSSRSLLSDYQPTHKLLCEICERKFDENGERKIIPQLRSTNNFPLREKYFENNRFVTSENLNQIPRLDFYAYAYFSLSVMWRGSVHNWPTPYHLLSNKLGPYQEPFRRWLNGDGEFPENTFVEILIDSDDDSPAFGGPNISKVNNLGTMRVYQFIALGVWFKVHVGGKLNEIGRNAFLDGELPIAFRKISFALAGINRLAEKHYSSTTEVGKLAKVSESRLLK